MAHTVSSKPEKEPLLKCWYQLWQTSCTETMKLGNMLLAEFLESKADIQPMALAIDAFFFLTDLSFLQWFLPLKLEILQDLCLASN